MCGFSLGRSIYPGGCGPGRLGVPLVFQLLL